MLNIYTKKILIILAVTFLPLVSFALSLSGDNAISLNITPSDPGPKETFLITLSTVSSNLNNTNITWIKDGEVVGSGIGLKKIELENGDAGEETVVQVVVKNILSGVTLTKELRLNPVFVDLLWEAKTYTPPFYKGKALPSSESRIKSVAIIKGEASDFVFNWKKSGNSIPVFSGVGKSSFSFTGPKPNQSTSIEVSVNSRSGSQSGYGISQLLATNPLIKFYLSLPLEGITYRNSIGPVIQTEEDETRIIAEPFYFSSKDRLNGDLSFSWRTTGEGLSDASDSFIIKRSGNIEDSISLSITNKNHILQSTEGGFATEDVGGLGIFGI